MANYNFLDAIHVFEGCFCFFFPFSRMLPTKPTPENFMNQAVNDQQLNQPVFYAKVP